MLREPGASLVLVYGQPPAFQTGPNADQHAAHERLVLERTDEARKEAQRLVITADELMACARMSRDDTLD